MAKVTIGDVVYVDTPAGPMRGLVAYIGRSGHLGVNMADGSFKVVRAEEVR